MAAAPPPHTQAPGQPRVRDYVRSLASDFRETREEALDRLYTVIVEWQKEKPITPLEMLQIWKGLFLMMWNTDKFENQIAATNKVFDAAKNLALLEYDDLGDYKIPEEFKGLIPEEKSEKKQTAAKKSSAVKGKGKGRRIIKKKKKVEVKEEEEEEEEQIEKMEKMEEMAGNEGESQNVDNEKPRISEEAKYESTGILLLLEEISEPIESSIKGIQHVYPHGTLYLMFVRSWILTICREMGNIDIFRMDKYLTFLRAALRVLMVVNATFGWGMGKKWDGKYDQTKPMINDIFEGTIQTLTKCVFNAKVQNGIKDESNVVFLRANVSNAGGRSAYVIPPSVINFIVDRFMMELNTAIFYKTSNGIEQVPFDILNNKAKLLEISDKRICPSPNIFTQLMLPIIQFVSEINRYYQFRGTLDKINSQILKPTALIYVKCKSKEEVDELSCKTVGFPISKVISPDCRVHGEDDKGDKKEENKSEENSEELPDGAYVGVPSLRQLVEFASGAEEASNKKMLNNYTDALWMLQKICGLYREGGKEADEEEEKLMWKLKKKEKIQRKKRNKTRRELEAEGMELTGAFRENQSHGWKTSESVRLEKKKRKDNKKRKNINKNANKKLASFRKAKK